MRSTVSLPDRVRGLAAERRMTQEFLAGVVLGISRPALRRRFNGDTEFTASEIEKLAEAFDVPIGTIFGESSAPLAELTSAREA